MPPELTMTARDLLASIGEKQLRIEQLEAYASSLERELASCQRALTELVPSTEPSEADPADGTGVAA